MKNLTFDDVLLTPAYNYYSSRRDVDISVTDKTGKFKLDLPVLSANMDTITEHKMARYMYGKGAGSVLHRFMSIDDNIKEFTYSPSTTFVSVGCSEKELERFEKLKEVGASRFCVDVAHGHAKYVEKMIKAMRDRYPHCLIMAGNVATYAGADYLASCGADIIKVGIGPGSVCSTRIKTGFGVSQLTAIKECSKVGRSIVADGGIRTPGDIVKALAFGADFVMIGGMLSGTYPTPGEQLETSNGYVKCYRGMASKEVADSLLGGLSEWKTAEGVETFVEFKNQYSTDEIIQDIVGGLRSGLTYGGAANIKEMQRKLTYSIVTNSTVKENSPHKLGVNNA